MSQFKTRKHVSKSTDKYTFRTYLDNNETLVFYKNNPNIMVSCFRSYQEAMETMCESVLDN